MDTVIEYIQTKKDKYTVTARCYNKTGGYYKHPTKRNVKREECFDEIIMLIKYPPTREELVGKWEWIQIDD